MRSFWALKEGLRCCVEKKKSMGGRVTKTKTKRYFRTVFDRFIVFFFGSNTNL